MKLIMLRVVMLSVVILSVIILFVILLTQLNNCHLKSIGVDPQ